MDIHHANDTSRGESPSLTDQTPGLDKLAPIRDAAMRQVTWVRENRAMVLSIFGGLAAIGLGAWLVLRSRRPSKMELLRSRGEELVDWLRDKLP